MGDGRVRRGVVAVVERLGLENVVLVGFSIVSVAGMMPDRPRDHWFPALRAHAEWVRSGLRPTPRRIDAPVAAINTTREPTNVAAMRRYAPSFTVDTLGGVGHAGILLRRVDEFDRKLLALVDRFQGERPSRNR